MSGAGGRLEGGGEGDSNLTNNLVMFAGITGGQLNLLTHQTLMSPTLLISKRVAAGKENSPIRRREEKYKKLTFIYIMQSSRHLKILISEHL